MPVIIKLYIHIADQYPVDIYIYIYIYISIYISTPVDIYISTGYWASGYIYIYISTPVDIYISTGYWAATWYLGCSSELSPIPTHAPATTPHPLYPMENPKLSETNLVFEDQSTSTVILYQQGDVRDSVTRTLLASLSGTFLS